MTDIEQLPISAAVNVALVAEITDLINRVYRLTEDGLRLDGAARTTGTEVAGPVRAGEIAVARLGSSSCMAAQLRSANRTRSWRMPVPRWCGAARAADSSAHAGKPW